MQPIPTTIAALLPLGATALSSWLNDDNLAAGANALISLVLILIAAIACMLLSASVPVTWPLRLLAVLGYVGVLMNGDLSVLYGYLVKKPSPIAPRPAPVNVNPLTSLGTNAAVPTPITLPSGASPVPPRASVQDQPK